MKRNDKHIVRIFLCLLVSWAVLITSACSPRKAPVIKLSGVTMGTIYHLTIVEPPAALNRAQLDQQIKVLLDQVDAAMSTYRNDSELTRFNRSSSTAWAPVSEAIQSTVAAALEISVMTNGRFDVTVAPLVDSWGFGPQPTSLELPTDQHIEASLLKVGYQMLHARASPPALRKDHPGLSIDLSAIAKGYAVDLMAEHLEQLGVNNYLVEIGGEIRVSGQNPEHQKWRIAVERPLANQRSAQTILQLSQGAVATSGDYRNFREVDDRRFSHTIDPQTGKPVTHNLASVTVIGQSAMIADALATALLVMGPDLAYQFANQHDLAVLLIIRNDDGSIELSTPSFAPYQTIE